MAKRGPRIKRFGFTQRLDGNWKRPKQRWKKRGPV